MASSILLRRSSSVFNKLPQHLRSVSAAPSITRSFNTNAIRETIDDDERDLDIHRRPESGFRRRDFPPSLFSDVFDPFSTSRSLSQVLNMVDQLMDTPFSSPARAGGLRRGWDAKEDNDGLHLRVDMPGLGKEDVKVSVEENTLTIKGEGEKEDEEDESGRGYSSRIDLPPRLYKTDAIKAEMKNGVLKVFVPKVKEDERKDVFQVQVD